MNYLKFTREIPENQNKGNKYCAIHRCLNTTVELSVLLKKQKGIININ